MTRLRTGDAWKTLRAAARSARGPALVAVAYLGQKAAELLPLSRGSRLVVDASEASVKNGLTDPRELRGLLRKGVRVYSVQNLHAKVFVFGTRAFVGSTNVSRRSEGALVEALLETSDRRTVAAARKFVGELCLNELGPEAIKRLVKIYRPPRIPAGVRRAAPKGRTETSASLPRVVIACLSRRDYPEGSEQAEEQGRRAARKRMSRPRLHELEDFSWDRRGSYKVGDVVIQVTKEEDGAVMVSPPGNVVGLKRWRTRRSSGIFVYVEVPRRQRVELRRLKKRLEPGARRRLERSGQVSQKLAAQLLAAWKTKG